MSSRQLFLAGLDHYNQIDDARRELFRDWSQFARNWSEEELAASMNGGANNDFDAGCSVSPLRSPPGGGRPIATERSLRRQIYEGLLNRDDFGRLSRTDKDKGVTTILLYGRLPQVLAKHAVTIISETYRQELRSHASLVVGQYREQLAQERSRVLPQPSIRHQVMAGGAGTRNGLSAHVGSHPHMTPPQNSASSHVARPIVSA